MINQKLFGVVLMMAAVATSSILLGTTWSQNVSAQMLPESIISNPSTADLDVEEATAAENATMTNKTTSENMTGTNSTR